MWGGLKQNGMDPTVYTDALMALIWQPVIYEAKDERSGMSLKAMQPLIPDHACMPHMKAMYVPFHMAYSGLICSKGLQSDRPK